MTSGIDPRDGLLLANLQRMSARMEKAQREIASGYKVNQASDAPDQVGDILALHARLAANQQVRTNLERAKSESDMADSALARVVQVMERAISLGTGAAGTLSESSRPTIAEEVRGLERQLVSLSRTMYGDRFLFSGDLDQAPCYQMGSGGTVERLASPSATRQLQHPSGVPFAAATTAGEIFDHRRPDDSPSSKNVFAAIGGLRAALEANDGEGIESALGALRAAHSHVNEQLGFYGAVQNRIAAALEDAARIDVRLNTALSERRDADLAASIMELRQVEIHQSAAMQARATFPRKSLFEYLR
jgi:flagellar hook-associated protein 3 FlgL